jgi:hypothetical protein
MTIVSLYPPNIGTSNFIRQILLDIKRQMDTDTITRGEFNITISSINKWIIQTEYEQRYPRV